MSSSFDTLTDRKGSHCYKWDEAKRDDLIPMWVADMDFRTAPAIVEALQKRVAHGIFGYTLVPDDYYAAIIRWFAERHGWSISREWIQYTSGVVPALSAVIKALAGPGDGVIVQTPVYNCFFSSIRNNGCRIVENRLKETALRYEMDFDDLERKAADPANKLLILCNPHNPSGRVWTRDELLRLNDICMRNGVTVIADEIHCELVYKPHRHLPFAALSDDCLNNSVTCTAPTKAFNIAGLQIANIICNRPATRQLIDRAININEVCDVNCMGIEALMAAYNHGGPWLDSLVDYIQGNYTALCAYIADHMPQIAVAPLEGTYLVWADCRRLGISSDRLTETILEQTGVQLNSGTMYGDAGEGFVRINIACPRSRMMEALSRMADCIRAIAAEGRHGSATAAAPGMP